MVKPTNFDSFEHLKFLKNRDEPPIYQRCLLDFANIQNRWRRDDSDQLLPEITRWINSR